MKKKLLWPAHPKAKGTVEHQWYEKNIVIIKLVILFERHDA